MTVTGGTMLNAGTIIGGTADFVDGGTGVDLRGSNLINEGTIAGSTGGTAHSNQYAPPQRGGIGGTGVYVLVTSLTNRGTIIGGDALHGRPLVGRAYSSNTQSNWPAHRSSVIWFMDQRSTANSPIFSYTLAFTPITASGQ
jgi:hypothetical protein